MAPDQPLPARRLARSGPIGLTGRALAAATARTLFIDAYVHVHDAGNYDSVKTHLVSQGSLFRAEAVVALVVGVALIVWPRRIAWAAALGVAATAFAAVMIYTYFNPGTLGPLPNMYEPTWVLPGKVASAWAEGAGTILAVLGLALAIRNRRTAPDLTHRSQLASTQGQLTSATAASPRLQRKTAGLMVVAGLAVALSLGLYARLHTPAGRPIFRLGFSGMLQMKAWLSTAALFFVLLQLVTALWMYGRLPGQPTAPAWTANLHRWSGSIGFVLSLPVAFHCLWALDYVTTTTRVLAHSTAGCLFYGAYATKMIGLRVRGLPAWAVPIMGGTVLTLFLVVWLTSALWLFTRQGIALT